MDVVILLSAMTFEPRSLTLTYKRMVGDDVVKEHINFKRIERSMNPLRQHHGRAIQFFLSLKRLLRGDDIPVLLLLLITFFSPDRPCLESRSKVEETRERYLCILQMYLNSRFPPEESRLLFPKLLTKLVEVAELGVIGHEANKQADKEGINPLFRELFSIE